MASDQLLMDKRLVASNPLKHQTRENYDLT